MRGLLAIECSYHQIVKGNKTQTRRSGGLEVINENPDLWTLNGRFISTKEVVREYTGKSLSRCDYLFENAVGTKVWCKPRYKVGEVLYLKEPWTFLQSDTCDFWNGYAYKFGGTRYEAVSERGALLGGTEIKFKNKLFMPSAAARAFVKITGIKCERLLDISDEDCIAEGIEIGSVSFNGAVTTYINYLMHEGYGYDYIDNTPKESFISLYKLANKLAKVGSVPLHGSLPTPLDVKNIWVWAYSFEYLTDYKYDSK